VIFFEQNIVTVIALLSPRPSVHSFYRTGATVATQLIAGETLPTKQKLLELADRSLDWFCRSLYTVGVRKKFSFRLRAVIYSVSISVPCYAIVPYYGCWFSNYCCLG